MKGTEAETDIVNFLIEEGFEFAERRTTQGKNDRGDINVSPDVVIEVKNQKTMTLAAWLDEAIKESETANAWLGVTWHKRPRRGHPRDWYVTMDGALFTAVLQMLKEDGRIR